jgi:4-hydroxy-3-methylbut-2-enyl diphosphate reductase
MEVIRARTAGFCMGVSLALEHLDRALADMKGGRIVTLGPIIHNPQVLAAYERKGVRRISDARDARPGDCVVVRAHGIPRREEELLAEKEAHPVDATCPKVKAAQLAIGRATAHGETLLLFGEAEHPEVRGLVSYARGSAHVFASLEEFGRLPLAGSTAYVLAAQTTQDTLQFAAIRRLLESRLPRPVPVLDTICDATRRRQEEALEIAARVDCMVVAGGRESGNTRRLAELVSGAGVPTLHVESADEPDAAFFAGKSSVGLTAGASTPKSLIDAVEFFLQNLQAV